MENVSQAERYCRTCKAKLPLTAEYFPPNHHPVTGRANGFRPDCRGCYNEKAMERKRKRDRSGDIIVQPLDNEDAIRRGRCIEDILNFLYKYKRDKIYKVLPAILEIANRLEPSMPYAEPERNVQGFHVKRR